MSRGHHRQRRRATYAKRERSIRDHDWMQRRRSAFASYEDVPSKPTIEEENHGEAAGSG